MSKNILQALSVLLGLFAFVELTLFYRSRQMRLLAARLGWTYSAGNNHIWKIVFRHKVYPEDFKMSGDPLHALWGTMNIIEGSCKGNRVVVLDSLLHFSPRYDRYVTFIGVKTDQNPFPVPTGRERVDHSNHWFAYFRIGFSLLTWSVSIDRIEELLRYIQDS